MVIANSGAEIVREYEGPYASTVLYKQRCDSCGYVSPDPPVSVQILHGSTTAYGIYHAESFVCPFCENHQVVEIEG